MYLPVMWCLGGLCLACWFEFCVGWVWRWWFGVWFAGLFAGFLLSWYRFGAVGFLWLGSLVVLRVWLVLWCLRVWLLDFGFDCLGLAQDLVLVLGFGMLVSCG